VCRRDMAAGKVDTLELHRLLDAKASIVHVKEALTQKADRSSVQTLKASQCSHASLVDRLVLLEDELQRKAAAQVCAHVSCVRMLPGRPTVLRVCLALHKYSMQYSGLAAVLPAARGLLFGGWRAQMALEPMTGAWWMHCGWAAQSPRCRAGVLWL